MTATIEGAKRYPEHHAHLQGLVSRLAEEIPGTIGGSGDLHKEAV
jgi:hypothetical protein